MLIICGVNCMATLENNYLSDTLMSGTVGNDIFLITGGSNITIEANSGDDLINQGYNWSSSDYALINAGEGNNTVISALSTNTTINTGNGNNYIRLDNMSISGLNAKMIITGDLTQIDLPHNQTSGLRHAIGILNGIKGITIINFEQSDIVRHSLVQRIVDAYQRSQESDDNE